MTGISGHDFEQQQEGLEPCPPSGVVGPLQLVIKLPPSGLPNCTTMTGLNKCNNNNVSLIYKQMYMQEGVHCLLQKIENFSFKVSINVIT